MAKKEKNYTDDKQKALDQAFTAIEKKYGKGAIMKMGDRPHVSVSAIPTGAINLDVALGVGGIPRGRVIEVYGPESSGKTTLALHIIAEDQKEGNTCAFIDAEHAMDAEYARNLGVDIDNLILSQPDTGEQGLDIAEHLVRSQAVDLIVIDSVAALVPKAEIEGEMGASHVGLQARLMSQALRRLTGSISKTNTTVLFINQLRDKVGVSYGSPETTTGGRALKFYSSVRLDIRRIKTITEGDNSIGSRTRVKIVKNKVAPPFKVVEFDIMYGQGISKSGIILDTAVEEGIIEKAGSWFSYGDEKLGQGREKVKTYLEENTDIMNEIEEKIRAKLTEDPSAIHSASDDEEEIQSSDDE